MRSHPECVLKIQTSDGLRLAIVQRSGNLILPGLAVYFVEPRNSVEPANDGCVERLCVLQIRCLIDSGEVRRIKHTESRVEAVEPQVIRGRRIRLEFTHRGDANIPAEGESVTPMRPAQIVGDVPQRVVARQGKNKSRYQRLKDRTLASGQLRSRNLSVPLGLKLIEVIPWIEFLDGAQNTEIKLMDQMRRDGPIKTQHTGVISRLEPVAGVCVAGIRLDVSDVSPVQIPRTVQRDLLGKLIVQARRRISIGVAPPLGEAELVHVGQARNRCQRLILGKSIDRREDACDRGIDLRGERSGLRLRERQQVYRVLSAVRSDVGEIALLRLGSRNQKRSRAGKRIVFLFVVKKEKQLI